MEITITSRDRKYMFEMCACAARARAQRLVLAAKERRAQRTPQLVQNVLDSLPNDIQATIARFLGGKPSEVIEYQRCRYVIRLI